MDVYFWVIVIFLATWVAFLPCGFGTAFWTTGTASLPRGRSRGYSPRRGESTVATSFRLYPPLPAESILATGAASLPRGFVIYALSVLLGRPLSLAAQGREYSPRRGESTVGKHRESTRGQHFGKAWKSKNGKAFLCLAVLLTV